MIIVKRLTLVLFLFLAHTRVLSQAVIYDWNETLKGPVKSFIQYEYKVAQKDGKEEKGMFDKCTLFFDRKGRELEYYSLNPAGDPKWNDIYTYDRDGNRTSYIRYAPNKSILFRVVWKYENGGMMEKSEYTGSDQLASKFTWTYDAAGRKATECSYKADGKMEWKTAYAYNDKGLETEARRYNAAGHLNRRTTHTYNEPGKILEERVYNSRKKLSRKSANRYDARGRLVENTTSEGGIVTTLTTTYDEEDNPIEDNSKCSNHKFDYRATYKYDKRHNITENTMYNYDGSLDYRKMYKFESFDDQGNWLKQTVTAANGREVVRTRIIKYY